MMLTLLLVLPPALVLPPVGKTVRSTVKSLASYGAFCSLEGYSMDGLLHVSQIDPNGARVKTPSEWLSIGDVLRVRVMDANAASGRVSLSARGVVQTADAPMALRSSSPDEALGKPPTAEELSRLDCVRLSYARASGAGGQNVNKLNTKCEARLRLADAPWPEGVRARLRAGGGAMASGGLELIAVSERHRTQLANRKDALERLASRVAAAWRPPKERRQAKGRSAKGERRRLEEKRRTATKKSARREGRRASTWEWRALPTHAMRWDRSRGDALRLLAWMGLSLPLSPLTHAAAYAARTKEDVSIARLLPEDKTLYVADRAPEMDATLECVSADGSARASLSDFTSAGRYVILWFYPEDALGSERANNEREARNFDALASQYAELDALVVGCSGQKLSRMKELAGAQRLRSVVLLSDPKLQLIDAYGARNRVGETFRQTFIIDPQGTIRWVERNVQYGVGTFNLDGHAARIQRELYQIRNRDGWTV